MFSGLAWNYRSNYKQITKGRCTCETYGTDTIESVNTLNSGQGTKWVIVSSNRDVDIQLGAFEVPQAGVVHVGRILEIPVQLLCDGVRNLDPRVGRIQVGGNLPWGSTGDSGVEGRGHVSPFNGIDDDVVGDVVVRASVVQKGIPGDKLKVREVVFLEFICSDIEYLSHVHDLAEGKETTKRPGFSSVVLEGVDEQSPIGSGRGLGENPGNKAIS